ncbi:MAG: hypothetical protein AUJ52_12220 [Elusimicrobia bacterium CG1_02_63_36]|nr:MAG: hypothetical protein AUJ52_12220 [Elusimicrobia bacterium CG1_02_63_36]PIP84901.1 MAG: hypothetical protein COR54_01705 [Elusimicrobia bacterium CG22_combo_CG10-13_8_21_14_all_63_91]PJA13386.1 MAG: hypothetical protein COX66_15000 [Elusimicrobia bacterium CG_4_10_14_0_2_um_filter_63_34]PJB25621.1 MAG: hypothetical protein CO113_07695 [Elusimicrobia bacterium CG_4_9_14_3_um_filter_62_55]
MKSRTVKRVFQFRVPPGEDLTEFLTEFCRAKKIRFGTVSCIGAVSKATLGYYEQIGKRYVKKILREELEIVSCLGNVSLRDGEPFLHLHAALSDAKLRTLGGHWFPGSTVFAAEVCITELSGSPETRLPDAASGLALWPCGL